MAPHIQCHAVLASSRGPSRWLARRVVWRCAHMCLSRKQTLHLLILRRCGCTRGGLRLVMPEVCLKNTVGQCLLTCMMSWQRLRSVVSQSPVLLPVVGSVKKKRIRIMMLVNLEISSLQLFGSKVALQSSEWINRKSLYLVTAWVVGLRAAALGMRRVLVYSLESFRSPSFVIISRQRYAGSIRSWSPPTSDVFVLGEGQILLRASAPQMLYASLVLEATCVFRARPCAMVALRRCSTLCAQQGMMRPA